MIRVSAPAKGGYTKDCKTEAAVKEEVAKLLGVPYGDVIVVESADETICYYYGPFNIEVHTVMLVTDNGTEDRGGECSWEGDSYCMCTSCEHTAMVKDFFKLVNIDLPSVDSPADGEPSGVAPTRDGG